MGLTLVLAGCAPSTSPLLLADAERDGRGGSDGPFAAHHTTLRTPARVDEQVVSTFVWPADEDGEAGGFGPMPALTLIHGGAVPPERYLWLAAHLASRGYPVLLPAHPLDLAILQADNARLARRDLMGRVDAGVEPMATVVDPTAAGAWLGHSLGAVVGAMAWVREPETRGLVMLGGFPAATTDVAARAGDPWLALVGGDDERAPPDQVEDELERMAEPGWLGVVDGLNHYGWTDDPTGRELASDGEPGRPVDVARRDALAVLDRWLDGWLLGDVAARDSLDEPFDGVVRR